MVFTTDDYKRIQKWLLDNSVKDTEFNEAVTPLSGTEQIPILQNGHNSRVILKDFIDQFPLLGVNDIINLTEAFNRSYIPLSEAIQLIPYNARKIGQIITFLDNSKLWKIYQFQGYSTNQWNNTTLWVDIIKASSESGGGGGGGDIIVTGDLSPDEEDLTAVISNDTTVVKFKDRKNSDPDTSIGKIILRRSTTGVSNKLDQGQLSDSDTIYVVQYDFDLQGQIIDIPENSILYFEGGKIYNGTIIFNNTKLQGNVNLDVEVAGSLAHTETYLKWFGYNDKYLQSVLYLDGVEEVIVDFDYTVSISNILIPKYKTLKFIKSTISINNNVSPDRNIFTVSEHAKLAGPIISINSELANCIKFSTNSIVEGITIICQKYKYESEMIVISSIEGEVRNAIIKNIDISGYYGSKFTGIYLHRCFNTSLDNIKITNIQVSNSSSRSNLIHWVGELDKQEEDFLGSGSIYNCRFENYNNVDSKLQPIPDSEFAAIGIYQKGYDQKLQDLILHMSINISLCSFKTYTGYGIYVQANSVSGTDLNCLDSNSLYSSLLGGQGKSISISNCTAILTGPLIKGSFTSTDFYQLQYNSYTASSVIEGDSFIDVKFNDCTISGTSEYIVSFNSMSNNLSFNKCIIENFGAVTISSQYYQGTPIQFNDCTIKVDGVTKTRNIKSDSSRNSVFSNCLFEIDNFYRSSDNKLYLFSLESGKGIKLVNSIINVNNINNNREAYIFYGQNNSVSLDTLYISELSINKKNNIDITVIYSNSHISDLTIKQCDFNTMRSIYYKPIILSSSKIYISDLVLDREDFIDIKGTSPITADINNVRNSEYPNASKSGKVIDTSSSNVATLSVNEIYGLIDIEPSTQLRQGVGKGVHYFNYNGGRKAYTLQAKGNHLVFTDDNYNRYLNMDGTNAQKVVIV